MITKELANTLINSESYFMFLNAWNMSSRNYKEFTKFLRGYFEDYFSNIDYHKLAKMIV